MSAHVTKSPTGAGRFAPSPTSSLHLGNLRTALLAWLFARADGLDFVLRIEDLDQARVTAAPGIADQQLRDLENLGLDWDGDVIRQSNRLELYRDVAASLDTYECYCSRRDIAEASQAPHDSYRPYPGTCAHLTEDERQERQKQRDPALRVRANGTTHKITDRFAGTFTGVVDDFVLIRNDGTPSYNLAVVVDDAAQNICQVTRGVDLLPSAPRHAWLATQLGHAAPDYAHVGLVNNADGVRLAKRDHPTDMSALLAQGLTPHDMLRILADSCGLPRANTTSELLAIVQKDPALLRNEALSKPVTLHSESGIATITQSS